VNYLSKVEIVAIHETVLEDTGGLNGVRDAGLLDLISEKPKLQLNNEEIYKSVAEKAMVYFTLANYQVFNDGNKRTAVSVMTKFLFINGYKLTASNESIKKMVLRTAVKKIKPKEIINWIEKYSKKINLE
jgi:death-on-curing protein